MARLVLVFLTCVLATAVINVVQAKTRLGTLPPAAM